MNGALTSSKPASYFITKVGDGIYKKKHGATDMEKKMNMHKELNLKINQIFQQLLPVLQ